MNYIDELADLFEKYRLNNPIDEQAARNDYDRVVIAVPSQLLGTIIGPALVSVAKDDLADRLLHAVLTMDGRDRKQLLDHIRTDAQQADARLPELYRFAEDNIARPEKLTSLLVSLYQTSPGIFHRALAYFADRLAPVKALGGDVIAAIIRHIGNKNSRACAS
jgi:hypothetical protein